MCIKNPWIINLIYGDFNLPHRTEPGECVNFFVFRYPSGRIPWSKEIVPALNRLVQSFVPVPEPPKHLYERVEQEVLNLSEDKKTIVPTMEWVRVRVPRPRKEHAHWYVDWGGEGLWKTKIADHYEWTGSEIRYVGRLKNPGKPWTPGKSKIELLEKATGKHIAQLRSICETFNGGVAHCTCGKPVNDPIHFSSKELKGIDTHRFTIDFERKL